MFNPLNVARSLVNPLTLAQVAMGPAGWASLAMRTVGTAIAQQVIQQVGTRLGLPPAAINLAQQALSRTTGQPFSANGLANSVEQFGRLFGSSAREIGQAQRQANDVVEKMVESILKRVRDGGSEGEGGPGESRLMKLARAMGKLLDSKMDKMIEVGAKMDKAQKQGELSAQMQALGQELSMISNALNNTIKSIGESNTTLARKS